MLDLQLMFQASKLQSLAYSLVRSPSSSIPQPYGFDERDQLTTRLIQSEMLGVVVKRPAQIAQSKANPISCLPIVHSPPRKGHNAPLAETCSIALDI